MQVLHILAAPTPDTSDFPLAEWLGATIVLVFFALVFGALFRWLYGKGHKASGITFGVLSLLSYTSAVAVLSKEDAVRSIISGLKGAGSDVIGRAQQEGVPATVAGVALAIAIFLAVYFLFGKNNQGSGILVGMIFGVMLLIASDHFEWVRYVLRATYRLLEILWPF